MPTYQYVCTECATPLEIVQTFTDPALMECPTCGGRLRKVFSAVGVVFKGSGFYRNDSREKVTAGAAKASGDGKVDAKSETKSDGKTDGTTDGTAGSSKKAANGQDSSRPGGSGSKDASVGKSGSSTGSATSTGSGASSGTSKSVGPSD